MQKFPEYQPGQAKAYLTEKNWPSRTSGDQLILKTCPFCGRDDFKFFISDAKGLWVCHHGKCARKGNFFTLLRELGDGKLIKPLASQVPGKGGSGEAMKKFPVSDMLQYEMALVQDRDAIDYLKSRGFTLETCQAWHFGLKEENGERWLMIPYLLNDRELADIKYRTLPARPADGESWSEERKWRRLKGGESILFGEHLLGEDVDLVDGKRVLYMTEGELDAVTLWQNGFQPAVSTTVGAGAWKERYYDMVAAYRPDVIYVVYDGDAAGQKGAAEVIKRFEAPEREVVNVVLPEDFKDSNKFFAHHTKEDFQKLLAETKDAEIPNVRSLGSVLDELATMLFLSDGSFQGIESEFTDINELLGGGFRNGELITISGIPGVGKTTLVMQELLRQAEHKQNPAYLLCLEMPEYRMAQKIITHKFHIPQREQTAQDVQRVHQYLSKLPFFMGSTVMDLDHVGQTLRLAKRRHDIKAACFDNLNYFVRSTDKVTAEIALFTKFMKGLSVELDIPIFLIAQPRKFDDTTRSMNIMDLKDSASIAQDSDVVMLLYRRRTETKAADVGKTSKGAMASHSPIVLARVEKSRYSGGGECYLYFDGAKSTYRELLPEEGQEAA